MWPPHPRWRGGERDALRSTEEALCGFGNILFPVDFSDRLRAAAPFVRALAEKNHASLTLVNFVEIPAYWYGSAEAPCAPEVNVPRSVEEARSRLTLFAGELFWGLNPEIIVQSGDAGSCIVEFAASSNVDIIMMPTRGRGRFREALLGSATAKVLHDADCAVWTLAHADSTEDPEIPTDWRRVVCAVDVSTAALCLIRRATQIASEHGASLHLVHAIPAPLERSEKYLDRDFEMFLEDTARKRIERMQRAAQVDFPVCVEAGRVSSVVAAAAGDLAADLVQIGRVCFRISAADCACMCMRSFAMYRARY